MVGVKWVISTRATRRPPRNPPSTPSHRSRRVVRHAGVDRSSPSQSSSTGEVAHGRGATRGAGAAQPENTGSTGTTSSNFRSPRQERLGPGRLPGRFAFCSHRTYKPSRRPAGDAGARAGTAAAQVGPPAGMGRGEGALTAVNGALAAWRSPGAAPTAPPRAGSRPAIVGATGGDLRAGIVGRALTICEGQVSARDGRRRGSVDRGREVRLARDSCTTTFPRPPRQKPSRPVPEGLGRGFRRHSRPAVRGGCSTAHLKVRPSGRLRGRQQPLPGGRHAALLHDPARRPSRPIGPMLLLPRSRTWPCGSR